MSRYRSLRALGTGPDGPVEEVLPDRIGGVPLARRLAPVPVGPRRHRLRDVAETLARIGHPGLATVVDVVDADDDHVEVVTTLGTDGTLADRVAVAPLPASALRPVLESVVEALAGAHGAGVAHGHIAATNVLVCDDRLLLADFGLTEARTGLAQAQPFRADVRDLAAMGTGLLDPADASPDAAALRTLLHWVADDPDATLDDLRRGLDTSPMALPAPPPPPPFADVAAPRVDLRRGSPAVLAGVAALVLGLVVGAGVVLLPGHDGEVAAVPAAAQLARSAAPCPPVDALLQADVDGDGCDDPVEWRSGDAEVAYEGPDGTTLRFRVGRAGDDLIVGDWDCDGVATAAVVRPDTGQTFLFDAWAASGETLTARPGPTLPLRTEATVERDGGCDRIRPAEA